MAGCGAPSDPLRLAPLSRCLKRSAEPMPEAKGLSPPFDRGRDALARSAHHATGRARVLGVTRWERPTPEAKAWPPVTLARAAPTLHLNPIAGRLDLAERGGRHTADMDVA